MKKVYTLINEKLVSIRRQDVTVIFGNAVPLAGCAQGEVEPEACTLQ